MGIDRFVFCSGSLEDDEDGELFWTTLTTFRIVRMNSPLSLDRVVTLARQSDKRREVGYYHNYRRCMSRMPSGVEIDEICALSDDALAARLYKHRTVFPVDEC